MHEKTIQWEEVAGSFIHGPLKPQVWKEQSKTELWSDRVSHGQSITQNNFAYDWNTLILSSVLAEDC